VIEFSMQPDGKILVAGYTQDPDWLRQHKGNDRFARLQTNGAIDPTFEAAFAADFLSGLETQADGHITVMGGFRKTGEFPYKQLIRIDAKGALDTSYDPSAASMAYMTPQTDGKMLVGGAFPIQGGWTSQNLWRLEANGTLDQTLPSTTYDSLTVLSMLAQKDGSIVVAGVSTYSSQTNFLIQRFKNTGPVFQTLDIDGETVTWYRNGPSPEVWRVLFEESANGTDWIKLGDGARVAGGWQFTVSAIPQGTYLRARGFVHGSVFGSTGWIVEETCQVGKPTILTQPSSVEKTMGNTVDFSVSVAGVSPLKYQWFKNGTYLNGATRSTLSLTNLQPSDIGGYSVIVTNLYGSQTSMVAILTVSLAPNILEQPVSKTRALGTTIGFNAKVAGADPLHYQWQKDGTNLPGATQSSLSITNLQPTDAGDYHLVVSNSYGSQRSSRAALKVGPLPIMTYGKNSGFIGEAHDCDWVILEASLDLLHWTGIETNALLSPDGKATVGYIFPSTNHTQQFYRIRQEYR
jgi:uncharacterized delta-60 repeat protein